MAQYEYFPQVRIDLAQELQYHPELQQLLANHNAEDFEVKLAEVAAYCDVMLDGYYLPEEIDSICRLLIDRLRKKRILIVR